MKTLKEIISDPKTYQSVIKDSLKVLDDEVSRKSGLTGIAIKGAYKLIKKVQGGRALEKAIEALLPEFIETLEPYFERYQKDKPGVSLESFLEPDFHDIADGLLSVTDRKIREVDNNVVRNTYQKLRPKAKKEVVASLPALARMIERYTS